MSKKVFNSDTIDDIFNIESDDIEIVDIDDSIHKNNNSNSTEDFVDEELKSLLLTAKDMLEAGKYIVETASESEAVAAAAALVNSIVALISELNKTRLIEKKYKNSVRLEKIKLKGREKLLEIRGKQKQLSLGQGNVFNIQNNNELVPFNQEDIIKKIIQEEKNEIIDISNDQHKQLP